MADPGLSRRLFITLLLLALLACSLPVRAEQPQGRLVRVVLDSNYPPFSFIDASGRLQGILVDQWRLWEQKSGARAELSPMDWGEALRRMKAGEFDVIDTAFETDQRSRWLEFTPPYQKIEVPIFFHRNISGIVDADSLKEFPVAVKEGDAAIDLLTRHGVTRLLTFPSYEAIIRAAAEHKVTVFVVDKPPALYFLNKLGIVDQFRASRPLEVGEFHRAVRKGNGELLKLVNSGFAAISPEELRAIDRKWYGSDLKTAASLRQFAYIACLTGLLIVLLAVWNFVLRRAVAARTAELAAGEERYRTLVENVPLGISLIDREHRIVMINRTLAEWFGHSTERLIGRHCYEAYEKREATCPHCPGVVSLSSGGISQVETEGVRDDGSRFSARIHTVPLAGTGGEAGGFIEVVEDITERKLAEQRLDNERARLHTLLQTIPDLVWLKDPDGVYLACNARFERFFGASESDILGKTDYDFVATEQADFFRANDRRAIEAGGPSINEEWVTFADGHTELLETIKTPMRDARGNLIGVLGIARDISRTRQAEESLRESELRYRNLVEVSPYAIYVHREGRLLFANPAGSRLLGAAAPEELVGKPIMEIVHPDYRSEVARRIREIAATGEPVPPLEELFVRLDGSVLAVEVVASPLTFRGEPAVQVLARDISDRKRLEEELIRGQKLESLGVLAGGIAHDFNNILTGIMGNISVARLQIGKEHKASHRLEECEKAARRAGELTKQLLTFARGGAPVRKTVDTKRIIDESLSFALRGANVKGIVDAPAEVWWIDADPGQMSQVFNNLLINAKQAMPDGGIVTLALENLVLQTGNPYSMKPGRYVGIVVTDQGCGIPPEHLPKVFDPYFTTKPQGNGLGLASVYSIIRRHGGKVTVTSRPGEGSCFTLLLPAAPGGAHGEKERCDVSAPPAGNGRILVMDDEADIRTLVVTMLEQLGYSGEACSDGSEAVALHGTALGEGRPYAALILDLTIPGGMGGREAAALIRERDPAVPIIVSSGYSEDAVVADYSRFGFSGVVVKPYDLQAMAAELGRLLGNPTD